MFYPMGPTPPPVSRKVGARKVLTKILGNQLFFSEVAIRKVRVSRKVSRLPAELSKWHAGLCAIREVSGLESDDLGAKWPIGKSACRGKYLLFHPKLS